MHDELSRSLTLFCLLVMAFNSFSKEENRFLYQELQKRYNHLTSINDPINKEKCQEQLNKEYQLLINLSPDNFKIDEIKENKIAIRELTWKIYLELRSIYKSFHEEQPSRISVGCVDSFRKIFLGLKYIDEYLVLNFFDASEYFAEDYPKAYQSEFFVKKNPSIIFESFNSVDFGLQSGDLILTRGNSPTSSIITRLGEADSKFSHLAMVYRDELNPEKVYLLEALIQDGANIKDFKISHLFHKDSEGKIRPPIIDIVLRFNGDRRISKLAAKLAYERLKIETPVYDFAMDKTESKRLYCAELISWSYELAYEQLKKSNPNEFKNENFEIPMYQTKFPEKSNQIRERLKIKSISVFSPGDIEFDPRFDVVLEWKDYTQIKKVHYLDAVFVKIFQWIEEKNYEMKWSLSATDLKSYIAKFGRKYGKFSEKFPKHMSRKQIEMMVYFTKLSYDLIEHLGEEDKMYTSKNQYSMTHNLYLKWLEELRASDEKGERHRTIFHHYFRP